MLLACAPSLDRQALGLAEVVQDLRPDKGPDSKYRLGEFVDFSFRLFQDGYVTLLAVNSDQTIDEIEKNLPLRAGNNTLPLPREAQGIPKYQIVEPLGKQRVRLIFTSSPGPTNWRFAGAMSEERLNELTRLFLDQSKARAKDVVETAFEVVR